MAKRFRERFRADGQLSAMPVHALLGVISIPGKPRSSPWVLIGTRVGYALILLVFVAVIVYMDRDGYSEQLTFIDALYYSAVSLSTTGYGDITPVTQGARVVNILLITP